jgi:hypothetical protein
MMYYNRYRCSYLSPEASTYDQWSWVQRTMVSFSKLTFPKSGRYVVGMLCLTAVSFEVDLNPEAV